MNKKAVKEPDKNIFTRDQVSLLAELQELELIIEESSILHRENTSSGIQELHRKAEYIRNRLPSEMLERYDRLRRVGPAVVNELDGICTGCRLNIPRGDLQRIRNQMIPPFCPNCYKFILVNNP